MDIQLTPEDVKALRIRDKVEAMRGCATFYETVIVDGREIPNLMMKLRDGTDGKVSLQFDRRFEIDVPQEYAPRVAWMIANSFAVGQGFACLASLNKDRPFAPEVRGLSSKDLGPKA